MITRKTKFKVSIKELSFEFEGSQEVAQQVQQGIQQTLSGLMNTQARVLALRDDSQVIDSEPVASPVQTNGDAHSPATDGDPDKSKSQRRGKKGTSLAALLRAMKEEKFFTQARLGTEVLARLKDMGHTYRSSNVLTELQRFVQRRELYRANNSDNVYVYKDTPFDEGPGTPSSVDVLAQ
jgi:hypothetical protein